MGWPRRDIRTFDVPFLIIDHFAIEKGLHEADAALGAGGSVPQVLSHRGELRLSVTRASLDDERCRRDCRQRSDLFRHQHRMPQRDQEQAADGPLVPHPQDAADQGHVLQVRVRSQGMAVSDGQAVQPGACSSAGLG